jgi:hypothetical protein
VRSSQDTAITVLGRYDMHAGDRSDAGVGSGLQVNFYVHMYFASPYRRVRNSSASFGRILATKDGALNGRCTLRMRFCASYISSFKTLFSVLGYIMLGFERMWVGMGVVKHSSSYPMGTRDFFPGGGAA